MSDCIKTIIDREDYWSKWKENKCFNFERPSHEKAKLKQRDAKRAEKMIGTSILIQTKEKDINNLKNGSNMKRYFR
jgi:hypothetical protein